MTMHDDTTNTPMPDDALLTAYALGALDGAEHAEQRATIEAQIASDPSLREQAEAIAAMGDQLEAGYAGAGEAGLSDAVREALPVVGSDGGVGGDRGVSSMNKDGKGVTDETHGTGAKSGPLARLFPYTAVAACAAGATAVGFLAFQGGGVDAPDGPGVADTGTGTTWPAADADASTGDTDTPGDAPDPRALMLAALDVPITVDYDAAPLGEVFDDLRRATGVNFLVDWPALEISGIDEDTLISLRLAEVPARLVLDYTLQQASANAFDDEKAGYRVGEQAVQVATQAQLKTDTEVRLYDIRALLEPRESLLAQFESRLIRMAGGGWGGGGGGGLFGDERDAFSFAIAPEFDLNEALSNGSDKLGLEGRVTNGLNNAITGRTSMPARTGPALPARPDTPRLALTHPEPTVPNSGGGLFGDDSESFEEDAPSREDLTHQVVHLIQESIGDPDEWLDENSTLREHHGQLIVKTTPENHEQIAELLALLETSERDESDLEALAQDPDRIDELAALFAHSVERRLVAVREREAQREHIERWQDEFAQIHDNPFHTADLTPLSTFSVDVDTASYTITRRALLESFDTPSPAAVRIEEFINYFEYDYAAPVVPFDLLDDGLLTTAALNRLEANDETFTPFATHVEVADCPWAEGHQLVRIGIKGMEVSFTDRPASHLTFLLDISGSMNNPDKLPLVKDAMVMLLDQLRDDDAVSIVVYAGGTGSVIEGVPAADYERIRDAIDNLQTQGGTNGEAGIKLAYQLAERYYVPGGVNRVVLCTDGDFNIGVADTEQLVELIREKANPPAPAGGGHAPAVYLSVFGVGTGNLNDEMMERLTNAGNGNYAYLDSVDEAARALSDQVNGTLVTIAKDVKIQIEFNPAQVAAYRLIGYENRILNAEDFNDDTVDAGDIGAGHTVTALYEIVPVQPGDAPQTGDAVIDAPPGSDIDELRYQRPRALTDAAQLPELLMLKLRYKPVDAAAEQGTSRRVTLAVPAQSVPFDQASETTRFAAAVAALGMNLRRSPHRGTADLRWVVATADAARQHDPHGYREQFIDVAERARQILEPGDED